MSLINPFKREEWKRLSELLDRNELNLNEALELREFARRAIEEYGDKHEAWKLHIYASIMVGEAIKKEAKK
jgi:hypothetical protein